MSDDKLDTRDTTKVKAYLAYTLPEEHSEPRENFPRVKNEKYKFHQHFQAIKFDIVEKLNDEVEQIRKQSNEGQKLTISDLKKQIKQIETQVNSVTKHSTAGIDRLEEVFLFLLDRSNYFIVQMKKEIDTLNKKMTERDQDDFRARMKIDELTEKVKALLDVETFTVAEGSGIENAEHGEQRIPRNADILGGATKTFKMKKHRN